MNKKWVLFFVMLMITAASFAQQYHFIYIQAGNQQPFYAQYNGKNYSSSAIGYLILPKLTDGDVALQIGFPKNLYPEQSFSLSVAGKDLGYALKNFDQKGWGLFNFQTTDVVMNASAAAGEIAAKETVTTNNSNPFGNMLASAINDSTLNQQRTKLKDTASALQQASGNMGDSVATATINLQPNQNNTANNSSKEEQKQDSLQQNNNINITKSAENKSSNGTDLTFLDNMSKDTIHAFIPSTDSLNVEKKAAAADSAKGKVDNPFFTNGNSTSTAATQPASVDTANSTGTPNNAILNTRNCQKMLSSYDADKLKKKLIKLDNQEPMLDAVRKSLRDKCITTDQVKDLGNLFLSDENRYGFYDIVYPFVSDNFNYAQLESTLIDTYYKNRFKALLR